MSEEDRGLLDRERELLGFDPYEQGWGEWQERTTRALIRAERVQGIIPREIEPDAIMVPGYRDL
jgi:hypothetical protein